MMLGQIGLSIIECPKHDLHVAFCHIELCYRRAKDVEVLLIKKLPINIFQIRYQRLCIHSVSLFNCSTSLHAWIWKKDTGTVMLNRLSSLFTISYFAWQKIRLLSLNISFYGLILMIFYYVKSYWQNNRKLGVLALRIKKDNYKKFC